MSIEAVHEPRIYEEGGPYAYFQDFYIAQSRSLGRDLPEGVDIEAAEARLQRHDAEYRRDRADHERNAASGTATDAGGSDYDYEVRANWTPGSGGYFAPPLWLIRRFANVPRPARVLARLMPSVPLPRGAQTVNVPVFTSGDTEDAEALNGSVSDAELATSANENAVTTIEGQEDVPLQMLEQSPQGAHLDWVIFSTLMESYDEELEYLLLYGSGNKTIRGLLNVPGISEIVYSSPAKGTTLYPIMGQAMAAVGNKRKVSPQAWLINTSRWAWTATSETTTEAPILITDNVGNMFPIGSLVGVNTYLDDAISTTTGGQVPLILCIPQDLLLLESDPVTAVMLQPLAGTMQARIQMHRYAAAITGRYPTGIAVITGTGTVPVEHF